MEVEWKWNGMLPLKELGKAKPGSVKEGKEKENEFRAQTMKIV
jgi:hypothetical protein